MTTLIRNWVIVFVAYVVLTLAWHQGIFGGQYPGHLDPIITTDAAGNQAPRMLFFMLAHVAAALGFVLYLPAVARTRGEYAAHGAVMGVVTFGTFTLLSHALFQNWSTWLMGMDLAFGVTSGVIAGVLMSYLAPKTLSTRSTARVG